MDFINNGPQEEEDVSGRENGTAEDASDDESDFEPVGLLIKIVNISFTLQITIIFWYIEFIYLSKEFHHNGVTVVSAIWETSSWLFLVYLDISCHPRVV